METPSRPNLPGTWLQTPAPTSPVQLDFRNPDQGNINRSTNGNGNGIPQRSIQESQGIAEQSDQRAVQQIPDTSPGRTVEQRARYSIATTYSIEAAFPDVDGYLSHGFSYDYHINESPGWAPFQKVSEYTIPDQIFEQYNRASTSTIMGLFAEIHHAWVSIDNALYIWDYTVPDPQLLGFEGQSSLITAVKLARPKAGVFVRDISHVVVLATVSEIMLLGLGSDDKAKSSPNSYSLFRTGISISVKGQDVTCLAASKDGRVFFACRTDNHIYELKYFRDEKWFYRQVSSICQSRSVTGYMTSFLPEFEFIRGEPVHMEQIVVDETRELVYTLSSDSSIRVFYMQAGSQLPHGLTKTAAEIYASAAHIISPNHTLHANIKIISISAITKPEGEKVHLVATTSTGYRIFLSATKDPLWGMNAIANSPMTMQVQHVKIPPESMSSTRPINSAQEQLALVNNPIKTLRNTRLAARYTPGYFFSLFPTNPNQPMDSLFVSCPDPARLAKAPEVGQSSRSGETAAFLPLGSRAEDIGISIPYQSRGKGYGNELAVQFDEPTPEIAVLTNTGVHVFRRTRLVDGFVKLVQQGGGPDNRDNVINNFIGLYGRTEVLATALAVACGQGVEATPSARIARVNDPEVFERARKVFIELGGKPYVDQNLIADRSVNPVDTVRPSPRHGAIVLYVCRLLRSIWRTVLAKEVRTPEGGYFVHPTVPLPKIKTIQENLSDLQRFLNANKSFIKGMTAPDSGSRSFNKADALILQGEHLALQSMIVTISKTIEALSFVLVLFTERVADILPLLVSDSRSLFLKLTFEDLILSPQGFELAKELVKAIVNRNIAKGSNVETIAEALRRRCGSFCSAEDVVIFKAQELLKRASETGGSTEIGRNLLNESLLLFKDVAEKLSSDYLNSAVKDFTNLQFYAGAIQLALKFAHDSDKANEAASWVAEDCPQDDSRRFKFGIRQHCYDLIHEVVLGIDQAMESNDMVMDGRPSLNAVRRNEANDIIGQSKDELFLTNLYDWYLQRQWSDRLLRSDSPFVITYLERTSKNDIEHADLLWKYHGQSGRYQDAAAVQLQLAKSGFDLSLNRRIEYLSQARANASTHTQGGGRKSKQKLLQEISEFLDVAALQDEVLQRLSEDPRLTGERKAEVLTLMNGPILSITELYNDYADIAGYYDICLLIYAIADYRDPVQTRNTWKHLLQKTHDDAEAQNSPPFELVAEKVRSMASRLRLSEHVFPITELLPMLEIYAFEFQRGVDSPTWVIDIFLELETGCEVLFDVLEFMWGANEAPISDKNRGVLGNHLVHVIEYWLHDTSKGGVILFDSEVGAARVDQMLHVLLRDGAQAGLDTATAEKCRSLRQRIAQILR